MSVHRVIHVVGTSTTSWEQAAADAIKTAGQSVRDLRVAESSSSTSTSGTAANSSTAPIARPHQEAEWTPWTCPTC
jgi:flavin-binding protein dodecin